MEQTLEQHQEEVGQLRHNLIKINERFDNVDDKVTDIYMAIVGNDKMGNPGLVKRIEKLEATEARWQQLYWKGIGILIAAAVVWQIFIAIVDKH